MKGNRLVSVSVLWLAATTIADPPVADSARQQAPSVIHEAPPFVMPADTVAGTQGRRIVAITEVMPEAFRAGVNVFDLGELTLDEITRTWGEEAVRTRSPNSVGWVRSIRGEPIRAESMRRLPARLANGAAVWTLSLRSAGAYGVRVHFLKFDVRDGEMVLFAKSRSGVVTSGPYTARGPNGDGDFWTGLIPGDTVFIEVRGATEMQFEIDELVHMDRDLDPPEADGGAAGGPLACHLDAMCATDISTATRLATGAMMFVVSGQQKLCTGTLLNDLDNETFVPYFITAYHCISSQAVANTLQVVWFWERASCGGTLPTFSTLPTTSGATLLATDDTADGNDMSFFRLNGPLPGGLAFAGWTTAHPDSAYGIHHPAGSWKRVTYFSDVGSCPGCTFCGDPFDYDYYDIDNGIIEGGSSGSGIFNFSGQLAGQLFGHCCLYVSCAGEDISCGNVDEHVAQYGEFETTYPIIRRWLEIGGTIHVNNTNICIPGDGTPTCPFPTVGQANSFAWNGARIQIRAGSYPETLTFSRQLTLLSSGGTATIGQ